MATREDMELALANYNGQSLDPYAAQAPAGPAPAGPAPIVPVTGPESVGPAPAAQPPFEVVQAADTTGMMPRTALDVSTRDYDEANARAQSALQDQYTAVDNISAERRSIADQQAEESKVEAKEAASLRAQYGDKYDQLMDERRAINEEISKTEIADSRSIGKKIADVISVALGGAADMFNAKAGIQSNASGRMADLVRQKVKDDIAMQQDALNNKRSTAADKLTELGIVRNKFGDDMSSIEYAAAARKERYAARFQELAAASQDEGLKSQFAQTAATLQMEAAGTKRELAKWQLQMEESRRNKGSGGPSLADILAVSREERAQREEDRQNAERDRKREEELRSRVIPDTVFAPGHNAGTVKESDVKAASEKYAAMKVIDRNLDEMKRLSEAGGTDAAKQYQLLMQQTAGMISQAYGSGTPQEAEQKRMIAALPDPAKWYDPTSYNWTNADKASIYDEARRRSRDNAATIMRTYKYVPTWAGQPDIPERPAVDEGPASAGSGGRAAEMARRNAAAAPKFGTAR